MHPGSILHLSNSDRCYRTLSDHQQKSIKQEIGRRIYATLQTATDLPLEVCVQYIKERLVAIAAYCETVDKVFIVVEEEITCDQYDLGGSHRDKAILFRGPSRTASVAICVTRKGSLLHRNGSPWTVYRNAGDIGL